MMVDRTQERDDGGREGRGMSMFMGGGLLGWWAPIPSHPIRGQEAAAAWDRRPSQA